MRTAEALQTIVASDYDYGQYIKSFRITMVDDNTQSSLVMSRFLWDKAGFASKTLNTSLLLLLKKATALESFLCVRSHILRGEANASHRWDVPIELSGAVYQALHRITGLRQLRLRLDVSFFSNLKLILHAGPLPGSSGISNHPPSTNMSSSFPSLPPLNTNSPLGTLPGPKGRTIKKKRTGVRNFWAGNRELSGFKQLHSLSLLGISSLDYLDEISGCLKSSTTTLKSLSLSLSHETAQKARKASTAPPPVDDVTSDDEEEDELVDAPAPPPPPASNHPIPTMPTRTEADVRKEKQAQEAILARIFDMEQHNNESKKLERNLILPPGKPESHAGFKNVMQDIKAMAQKLSELKNGGSGDSTSAREVIEAVHKATAQYLSKTPSMMKKSVLGKTTGGGVGDIDATGKALPSFGSSASQSLFSPSNESSSKAVWTPGSATDPGGWDAYKAFQELANNKDIDINSLLPLDEQFTTQSSKSYLPCPSPGSVDNPPSHTPSGVSSPGTTTPLGELDPSASSSSKHKPSVAGETSTWNEMVEPNGSSSAKYGHSLTNQQNGSKDPSSSAHPAALDPTQPTKGAIDDSGDIDMIHPDEDPTEIIEDQEMISDHEEASNVNGEQAGSLSPRKRVRFEASQNAEFNEFKPGFPHGNGPPELCNPRSKKKQSPEEVMQAWIRETHGYQLEEVKLYWIPMRAGILSRALDLPVLRRITLLNCGSQDGFWMILAGFQARQGTIALTSIHTDNVSKSFLRFLRSFDGLTELFMHERSKKNQVEAASAAQNKIGITEIRRQALRKHLKTLRRLMIKNEYDSSWDLDAITITLLSIKGSNLVELAISLGALPFVSPPLRHQDQPILTLAASTHAKFLDTQEPPSASFAGYSRSTRHRTLVFGISQFGSRQPLTPPRHAT